MKSSNSSPFPDLPLGLGMAFAQNVDVMEYFSSLSKSEQQGIIDKAHAIRSRREMHDFVAGLGKDI